MAPNKEMKSVLFICLGNICRSPIAEAVFLDLIEKQGVVDQWKVDSAAVIGYHTGKNPEKRATATLKKFGITSYTHKVREEDFVDFDYIFGMDNNNMRDLEDVQASAKQKNMKVKAKLSLLGEFDPQNVKIVPDPYYEDGSEMFEQVYHQCRRCCEAFLEQC